MDLETLLTGTKWEMIELLSKESLSPTEIAEKLNTSIANISQQMRLLQAAGLIKKQKVSSGKPGKPRTCFSLSEDFALITIFSKGFAKKKLIKISSKQKELLKELLKE
jgi:DNA-binding transcriptional regulator GbsR (MarR family)